MTVPLKTRISALLDLTRSGKLDVAVKTIQASLSGEPLNLARTAASENYNGASGIADAINKLWKTVDPAGARTAETAPSAGRFTIHNYRNAAGERYYKLYQPAIYKGGLMPLVVMLHGCTQSADDFAAGTRMNSLADEFGFVVAYPEQTQKANSNKCWNWFNTADQQRDLGEPSIIAGLTRDVIANYAIDQKRVFAAGLSAGAAAAAILGQTYPDIYSAVGIHSGLACGAARDMMSAFGVMKSGAAKQQIRPSAEARVRAIVFHGDRDQTVHPLNGDQAAAQFMGANTIKTVMSGEASGATYTRTNYTTSSGRRVLEQWLLNGIGHAWSGGSSAGSYTSVKGPDASREMIRFFLEN